MFFQVVMISNTPITLSWKSLLKTISQIWEEGPFLVNQAKILLSFTKNEPSSRI